MFEITPKKVFLLDSSIFSLVQSDSCYLVTSKGYVYRYENGSLTKVIKGVGPPKYALPGLGGLVTALQSSSGFQVYAIAGESAERVLMLPKLDGLAASRKLISAWYGDPKRFLRTSLTVLQRDSPPITVETQKIVCACCWEENLYFTTIDGRLRRLSIEGNEPKEKWSINFGAACDWLLPSAEVLFAKRGNEVVALSAADGSLLRIIKAEGRRGVVLNGKLVLWETERPSVLIIDPWRDVKEVKLEPVFMVIPTLGEEFYLLMRWKLAVLDVNGEIMDAFYMPIPLAEHLAIGPPLLFCVREWLIESEPAAPSIQLRKIQIETIEARTAFRLELFVFRPGSLEPIEDARITVTLGRATERATCKGGTGRATLLVEPGRQRLTLATGSEIRLGEHRVEKVFEVTRELEIPSIEPTRHTAGDMLGRRIVLQEILGSGGFGSVYRGRDIVTDRLVAVKIPHSYFAPEEVQAQLVIEAQKAVEASRRLNREQKVVVETYEAGVYDLEDLARREKGKVMAIVMEYCEGGSLRSRLESGALKNPLKMASKIAKKVLLLNQEGIIHGDLKPENILFITQDEPLLADFYTATLLGKFESLKRYRELAFTEGYAPPELMERGEVSPKTDVYSLAVLIVEMLTGSIPSAGSLPAKLLESLGSKPKLVQAISDALSPNPRARPSVEELLENLID